MQISLHPETNTHRTFADIQSTFELPDARVPPASETTLPAFWFARSRCTQVTSSSRASLSAFLHFLLLTLLLKMAPAPCCCVPKHKKAVTGLRGDAPVS